jgi:hypothetical protein
MPYTHKTPGGFENNYGKIVILFILITFATRLIVFVYGGHQYRWVAQPFGYEHSCIAISLLKGEGYSSPYRPPPTGPTMAQPPILPLILAAIFRMLGTFTLASYVAWIVINLCFSATCSALVAFVARNSFGPRSAVLSQAFYALNIFELYKFRFTPANLGDEVYSTLLVLVAIAGFIYIKNTVGRGIFGGLILFAHPLSFGLYCLFILTAYVRKKTSFTSLATVFIISIVTISPLIIRNHIVLGGFSLSKSNFFLEAYLGNVPDSQGIVTDKIYTRHHPQSNVEQRRLMAQLGEIEYMRRCRAEFFSLVRKEPARYMKLTLNRITYFWLSFIHYAKTVYPDRSFLAIMAVQAYYILSLFSILFCLYRFLIKNRTDLVRQVIVIFPFVYSIPYLLTHVTLRYRTPIEPVIMIIMGATIIQLKGIISRREVTVTE